MFRGHRKRAAAGSRPAPRRGHAGEWVSVRERQHRRSISPLVVRIRPLVEPVSVVDNEFVRQRGFYVRVGALGLVVATLFAILLLRLWSLQLIHGTRYAHVAQAQ